MRRASGVLALPLVAGLFFGCGDIVDPTLGIGPPLDPGRPTDPGRPEDAGRPENPGNPLFPDLVVTMFTAPATAVLDMAFGANVSLEIRNIGTKASAIDDGLLASAKSLISSRSVGAAAISSLGLSAECRRFRRTACW